MPERNAIWIITGEASGDDYGARLAERLQQLAPALVLRGMGGAQLRQAGVDIVVDSSELGVVGIVEVLRYLPQFLRLFRTLLQRIRSEHPAAVVLIDYPGFNLRLAKKLRGSGIPVFYYISPQVWAWKKGRIKSIVSSVTRMFCIFPFEPAVYAGTPLPVEFVGHPLLQALAPYRQQQVTRDPNLLLLLPGSRGGELHRILPTLLQTAGLLWQRRPELRFILALPREKTLAIAQEILAQQQLQNNATALPPVEFSVGQTREKMLSAVAGIAASGTVTVEAAILDLPLVVTYKLNTLSWHLVKHLVKLPWITIANLVCNTCVYEEYLQDQARPENLAEALLNILPDGKRYDEVRDGMQRTRELLGGDADVADTVARKILQDTFATLPEGITLWNH